MSDDYYNINEESIDLKIAKLRWKYAKELIKDIHSIAENGVYTLCYWSNFKRSNDDEGPPKVLVREVVCIKGSMRGGWKRMGYRFYSKTSNEEFLGDFYGDEYGQVWIIIQPNKMF